MAEKDKLSKEVEEQIQSLASDVYIQVEEKLTQLITAAMAKEASKKIAVEQDPAYLALQNNYQTSENELAEKSKHFSEKITLLEQEVSSLAALFDEEKNKQKASQKQLKTQDANSADKISQLTAKHSQLQSQLADELSKQEASEQNFQVELTQNNINFTETIERLEHENTMLKATLADEQSKLKSEINEQGQSLQQTIDNLAQEASAKQTQREQAQFSEQEQAFQSKIADHEKAQQEQQQGVAMLNESLAVLAEQEQSLTERLDIVEQQRANSDNKLQKAEITWQKTDELQTNTLIEQKNQIVELTKQLNVSLSDLEHIQEQHKQQLAKNNQDAEQKKTVASQQEQQNLLEDKVKQDVKIAQEYKQQITQNNDVLAKLKQQQLEDKKSSSLQHKQSQQECDALEQQLAQLTTKNQQLADNLITEQADIKLYQKEVSSLKSQVKLAQEGQENILNRYNANRDKQEKENDQVRETIKYLRDENSDMITQHNEHKEQFIGQIHDLESKLTEYRLKFEYAQKQLMQNG